MNPPAHVPPRADSENPSWAGWLLYRYYHYPLKQLRARNPDFWLYLLLRRVRGGPFAGLRYVGESPSPQIGPFLLGLNEIEIWPFVRRLLAADSDAFVNVGAAEGYYAVGMARFGRFPRVISYEGSRLGRVLTRFMARKNGVADRVDVRGQCDPELLALVLEPFAHPALLIDVEGYEELLADPDRVPALRRATMIIELHEQQRPMADLLRPRFADTHEIEEVWTRARTLADLPVDLRPASLFYRRTRLLELGTEPRQGPMRWWLLTPKERPA